MVNENNIPKVETIYEIKNEIPTFEEFLKTYENDGNLNYDDLNNGDIGTPKGYGPTTVQIERGFRHRFRLRIECHN